MHGNRKEDMKKSKELKTTELVSANIRALMAIQRKTTAALAVELKVARQTAGLYTNGSQAMTSDQLAIVATWLGVSVGELFRKEVYELAAA